MTSHRSGRHHDVQNAVIRFFADAWKGWQERRARLAAFDRADANEMSCIARELGVPPSELRRLVKGGAHSADLLLARMHSINLDASKVEPAVMRDLQRCCSGCAVKALCAHELEDRPKGARWPEYCPNQVTVAALHAGSHHAGSHGSRP